MSRVNSSSPQLAASEPGRLAAGSSMSSNGSRDEQWTSLLLGRRMKMRWTNSPPQLGETNSLSKLCGERLATLRPVNRAVHLVARTYLSKQFVTYILCGCLSAGTQVVVRYALEQYASFSLAVLVSYLCGMCVALLLYRFFVFDARKTRMRRQFILFSLAYLAFLPVTWAVSVGAESVLRLSLSPVEARLFAHLLGVSVPVVLNFAFNKFVTFREPKELQEET